MPKGKSKNYTQQVMSFPSNVGSPVAKSLNTGQSKPSKATDLANPIIELEAGSQMGNSMKTPTKKSTDKKENAVKKFEALFRKTMDKARMSMNNDMAKVVMRDRVKSALAAEFGTRLSVAEIDKYTNNAIRSMSYEFQELKEVPAECQLATVTNTNLWNHDHATFDNTPDEDELDELGEEIAGLSGN